MAKMRTILVWRFRKREDEPPIRITPSTTQYLRKYTEKAIPRHYAEKWGRQGSPASTEESNVD